MWGECDESAVGYFMSVAIPASYQAGEVVHTHSCHLHSVWFLTRHPNQTFIRADRSDAAGV